MLASLPTSIGPTATLLEIPGALIASNSPMKVGEYIKDFVELLRFLIFARRQVRQRSSLYCISLL